MFLFSFFSISNNDSPFLFPQFDDFSSNSSLGGWKIAEIHSKKTNKTDSEESEKY